MISFSSTGEVSCIPVVFTTKYELGLQLAILWLCQLVFKKIKNAGGTNWLIMLVLLYFTFSLEFSKLYG